MGASRGVASQALEAWPGSGSSYPTPSRSLREALRRGGRTLRPRDQSSRRRSPLRGHPFREDPKQPGRAGADLVERQYIVPSALLAVRYAHDAHEQPDKSERNDADDRPDDEQQLSPKRARPTRQFGHSRAGQAKPEERVARRCAPRDDLPGAQYHREQDQNRKDAYRRDAAPSRKAIPNPQQVPEELVGFERQAEHGNSNPCPNKDVDHLRLRDRPHAVSAGPRSEALLDAADSGQRREHGSASEKEHQRSPRFRVVQIPPRHQPLNGPQTRREHTDPREGRGHAPAIPSQSRDDSRDRHHAGQAADDGESMAWILNAHGHEHLAGGERQPQGDREERYGLQEPPDSALRRLERRALLLAGLLLTAQQGALTDPALVELAPCADDGAHREIVRQLVLRLGVATRHRSNDATTGQRRQRAPHRRHVHGGKSQFPGPEAADVGHEYLLRQGPSMCHLVGQEHEAIETEIAPRPGR